MKTPTYRNLCVISVKTTCPQNEVSAYQRLNRLIGQYKAHYDCNLDIEVNHSSIELNNPSARLIRILDEFCSKNSDGEFQVNIHYVGEVLDACNPPGRKEISRDLFALRQLAFKRELPHE